MKIVFATSEAAPFIKTGGLGDVAQALPASLASNKGVEVCVFLPYYDAIKNNPNIEVDFVCNFDMNLSWRHQYVGIFKVKSRSRKYKIYFIDNEYYFARGACYGFMDDGERFAYFSKAVLEAMLVLGIKADIIQCNDWQTALIPTFLHAFYHDTLGEAKTVFTIHNIEYQGKADQYFIGDTLGLPDSYTGTLMYDNCVNFMKAAILTCDALTTVSNTYAEEIQYPYYAHGLASVIKEHNFKLTGIVNGIDTEGFNPQTDKSLFANYGPNDYNVGKKTNKLELQKKLGLRVDENIPLIGMVSRLVAHKGAEIFCGAMNELMNWNVQIVILGTGDQCYEHELKEYANAHPDKLSVNLCFNLELASQIYAASDIYLMPSKSEPCGLSQLIAMRYGTIPVVNATGGLKDTVEPFNVESGQGTGFNFQSFNTDDMLDALRRTLSVYGGDKQMWAKIVENAFKYDSSWNNQTKKYLELYQGLINKR